MVPRLQTLSAFDQAGNSPRLASKKHSHFKSRVVLYCSNSLDCLNQEITPMFSSLLQYIKKNFLPLSATIVGVLFLVFSIMNQQWWGERAFGVIIGATVLSAVITSMYF